MQDIGTVREHMVVIGSDGELVGTVDRVEGEYIRLRRDGSTTIGSHHLIRTDWIAEVDDEVLLSVSAAAACRNWREQAAAALAGDADRSDGFSP
jgi:hypothetical protein